MYHNIFYFCPHDDVHLLKLPGILTMMRKFIGTVQDDWEGTI